jgi:hypothetical protein
MVMGREDRQMTREEVQKVVDELMPGLKLPDPRTEEEFLAEDNRTTLGLQGFKQRELHTVMWALREFADAAGIELHNGIKERYDAERKTYGISLRFYKK